MAIISGRRSWRITHFAVPCVERRAARFSTHYVGNGNEGISTMTFDELAGLRDAARLIARYDDPSELTDDFIEALANQVAATPNYHTAMNLLGYIMVSEGAAVHRIATPSFKAW
jgi:hypothetical protein